MTKYPILIPAIDLIDGKVVRLTQGDYGKKTTYNSDPLSVAKEIEAAGASHLHIIDLDGAKAGQPINLEIIQTIRQNTNLIIQVGGGIRSLNHVETLLNLGVNHLILGSILMKDRDLATSIINSFPNKIIGGVDIKDKKICVEGWLESSQTNITEAFDYLNPLPLFQIIVTDIQKDGTLSGPNIDLLNHISSLTHIPIGAAGGISSMTDLELIQKKCPGVNACIIGKAIYEGHLSIASLFQTNE